MKTLISAIVFSILTSGAYSQSTTYNEFISNFEGDEDITNVNISGALFSLMGEIAMEIEVDSEIQDFVKIADGIDQVNIFTVPHGKDNLTTAIENLHSGLLNHKYDHLANFKKGNENTDVFMLGTRKSITNAMILIEGTNEFTVLSIVGDLTYSDLSELIKNMDRRH